MWLDGLDRRGIGRIREAVPEAEQKVDFGVEALLTRELMFYNIYFTKLNQLHRRHR